MITYLVQPTEPKLLENRPVTPRLADHGLWSNFLNATLATLRVNAEQYRLKKIHNLDGRMLADIGLDADALDLEATGPALPARGAQSASWGAALQ